MTSLNRTTPSYTPSPPLHTFRRLSDADKDDLLSFLDFVVAVHLVNLALKGVVAVLNHWVHCGPGLGTHTHTCSTPCTGQLAGNQLLGETNGLDESDRQASCKEFDIPRLCMC